MNPVSHITTVSTAPVAHVAAEPKVSTVSASNVQVGREAVVRLQAQSNQHKTNQSGQQAQNHEQKINTEVLERAVSAANFEFSGSNEGVSFTYNEKLNQLYVQVIDQQSGKVIREIPPKEFIEHQAAMRERIGLLLSKLG
ncbi:MAG: flagellar protein FlaG [Mariprofundaceae bacterium]|nr:flagellar protein FlaG [Mariprofundaceae bacterium]